MGRSTQLRLAQFCQYFEDKVSYGGRVENNIGKGNSAKGKEEQKTCNDSSIGSCVRATVTEARRHTCDGVCVRGNAYCSKMLAAQQKKTMPWLN